MTTTTLLGADDPDRAPVAELRSLFTPEDGVVCRVTHRSPWRPLYSCHWDDHTAPVEWTGGA